MQRLSGLGQPGQRETRRAGWETELFLPVAQTGTALLLTLPVAFCAQFIAALLLHNTVGTDSRLTVAWLWWQPRLLIPALAIRHLMTLQWSLRVNTADPNWSPPAGTVTRMSPLTPLTVWVSLLGALFGKKSPEAPQSYEVERRGALEQPSIVNTDIHLENPEKGLQRILIEGINADEWEMVRKALVRKGSLSVLALRDVGLSTGRARYINQQLRADGKLVEKTNETKPIPQWRDKILSRFWDN